MQGWLGIRLARIAGMAPDRVKNREEQKAGEKSADMSLPGDALLSRNRDRA